jgi:peptidoglycan/xylan/chitin deacetylase (PgdA/CDA1 family)
MERRVPWPDEIQCPVALDFHVDAESLLVAIDPQNATRPITLSQGTYGPRVGVTRILALLRKYGITGSFCIPAITAERHPYVVEEILEDGHFIGLHGYTHRRPDALSREEEEEEMAKSIEILERLTGQKMRGYSSPAGEYSPNTIEIMRKHGLEFGADGFDDDVPYYMQVDGEPTGLLQIPLSWTLDDAPLYWFNLLPPLYFGGPYAEPSRVYELWTTEFDAIWEEGACYRLVNHPFLSGRGVRVKTLERVIQYMMGFPRVKFVTLGELNDMYRAVVPPDKGRPGMWDAVNGKRRDTRRVEGVPILA